jgi:hypothetical protein
MHRLTRNEYVAMLGGLLLAVSVALKWYESVSPNGTIAGETGLGTYTAWEAHDLMRWVLLAAAVAPFVLAYIVVRDHELSWARGELTAVIAIAAFGLVVYNGIIDRPGDPSGQIELEYGWYVALVGTVLMLGGSALRSTETERRRKPPGTI